MGDVVQEIVDYKAYKIKPYLNSDKEPFGLTINGKTKEYIDAHENLKQLLKKGKEYTNDGVKIKVLDVTNNKGMSNMIIEVLKTGEEKGNVEVKIYVPSVQKKKGATIEMRKCSGFNYAQVEMLKTIITNFLDGFMAGSDVNEVIKNSGRISSLKSKVTSKPKLFNCDLCNLQTRFGSALKAHVTRIHVKKDESPFKCNKCIFCAPSKSDLAAHMKINHKPAEKRAKLSSTPTSSPPAKKHEGLNDSVVITIDEKDTDVDMMDLEVEVEARDVIYRMLQARIDELEAIVAEKDKKLKNLQIYKTDIPDHLHPVKEKHLSNLRGYRMVYRSQPDGACLDSCAAVHVYEDADEASKLKKRVNHHVADNWDNYYKDKIPLPYTETVGVGKHAHTITKTTDEEMIDFLRSDDALMVYSNSQQILAMANLFNMNVNIFTFGGLLDSWRVVMPDPEMSRHAEFKLGKCVPDMALYHNDESHFDLLVKDDSRLALLGLLAGTGVEDPEIVKEGVKISESNDEWTKVNYKRRNGKEEMEKRKILIRRNFWRKLKTIQMKQQI